MLFLKDRKKTFYSALSLLLLLFFSCDAPRINPLDPQNPDYTLGQLDGYVYISPRQPVAGVRVLWKNQNVVVETDSSGYFKISDVQRKDGMVYYEKTGLARDSASVKWGNEKAKRINDKILNYASGVAYGYVYTPQRQALSGVQVIWESQNVFTQTDKNGYYQFSNATTDDGTIYFEKDGFARDSADVQWDGQLSVQIDDKTLNYSIGQIDGYVKKVALPRNPIQGVKVFWKNQNVLVETDATGYYKIDNISRVSGKLYFDKDGFSSDSLTIQWGEQRNQRADDVFLNANPTLNYFGVYTSVENTYSNANYSLFFDSSISDEENDVDSVFVSNADLNFMEPLVYNPATRYYSNSFETSDLHLTFFEDVIGKSFGVIVKDINGKVFNVGGASVKRIIKQLITVQTPSNKDTVNNPIELIWDRFIPGFSFKYKLEIYTNELSPVKVWSKGNISQDAVNYTVDQTLPKGDYYWVVWCIDDFQNRCRSIPVSFVVQ